MKRPFILVACLLCATIFYVPSREKVKFLIFSDLHYDIIPDGDRRLHTILAESRSNQVDWVMELGDFVPPFPRYAGVKEILRSAGVPVYHVLGNHDIDRTDKQTYVDFWEMPASSYYFDRGNFRFIVLDSGFFEDENGAIVPYEKGNYYARDEKYRNRFGQAQLDWLRELLQDTGRICILFSHGPVNDGYDTIRENRDVHRLLTDARQRGTRIAAVFGGHIHSDNFHCIDGIPYMQVNSASYIWGGEGFENTERYPDSVYVQRPSLKYIIPYETALYAVVEVDDAGSVTVRGAESRYIRPEAGEALLETKPYPCSPVIKDRKFTY